MEDETIDFFSSGHALVEGLLAHFEDDPKGRVARLEVHLPGDSGRGVVALYKEGPVFDVDTFDTEGRHRPEWADAFRRRSTPVSRMAPEDAAGYDWRTLTTRLASRPGQRPYAVAAIVVKG